MMCLFTAEDNHIRSVEIPGGNKLDVLQLKF